MQGRRVVLLISERDELRELGFGVAGLGSVDVNRGFGFADFLFDVLDLERCGADLQIQTALLFFQVIDFVLQGFFLASDLGQFFLVGSDLVFYIGKLLLELGFFFLANRCLLGASGRDDTGSNNNSDEDQLYCVFFGL